MSWWKPRERSDAPASDNAPLRTDSLPETLREFVYLDEVSVYSLTSSPDRPPAAAMFETLTTESKSDWGTTAGVGTPVLAKAGVTATFGSADATGLEIQRRFNVQSLFAVLHQRYSNTFRLRRSGATETAALEQVIADEAEAQDADLYAALRRYRGEGRAVSVSSLRRGDLIELPISLSAHAVFALVTTVQGIGSLLEKFPGLADGADAEGVRVAVDVAAALDDLMVGLVPIEGVASAHQVLTLDSGVWIVESSLLERDPHLRAIASRASPLRLVGVTERERYWKDTRRVLHADQQFDVLARVSVPDLKSDWSPIKMVHAFDKAVPGLGSSFTRILNELPTTMRSGDKRAAQTGLVMASEQLATLFAERYEVALDLEATRASALSLCPAEVPEDLEAQLSYLWRFLDELHELSPGLDRDRDAEGELRQKAIRVASSLLELEDQDHGKAAPVAPGPPALLEVEFVAIYW